jgi:ribosome-associated protein YbcJ (S4-like RNA binding protein)
VDIYQNVTQAERQTGKIGLIALINVSNLLRTIDWVESGGVR